MVVRPLCNLFSDACRLMNGNPFSRAYLLQQARLVLEAEKPGGVKVSPALVSGALHALAAALILSQVR